MQNQARSTSWPSAIDRSIAIDLLATPGLKQWSWTWVKSPLGDNFMRCGGDFVSYEIWGGFRFLEGRFLQVKTYSNVQMIPKNQYLLLWNQSIWCTFDSMVRNNGYKTHIGLVTHQSNYRNMVLWNASLHQISKTTEIVTGLGPYEDYRATDLLT